MTSALDKIKAYKNKQTNPINYLSTSGLSALDKIKKYRQENSYTQTKKEVSNEAKKSTPVNWNKIKEEQNKTLATQVDVKNTIIKESKNELPTNYTLPTQSKIPTNYNQNVIEEANKNVTNTKGWKGLDISQIVKVPENFKDGYQFGDITKTIGSTALDLGTSATKGIFSLGEGIGDLAQYGVAQFGDWLGADDFADQLRKNAQQDVTSMIFNPAENMYGKNSVAGETTTQVAEGVGNVLGMAYGGGVLPKPMRTIGKGAFKIPTTSVISGMGGGMTEAYNNGATDREAWLYGLGSGFAEGFSESLFGGLGSKFAKVYGGGALDDVLIKNVTNRITNSTMRTLAQSGLKAVGEGAEEVISGLGSAIAKKLTYLSDEDFGKIVQDENLLEQFIMGTLTSAIMQVPSTVNAVKNGTEYIGELQKNIESNNTQNTPKTIYDLVQQEQNSQNNANLPIVDNNGNIVNSNKSQYINSDNIDNNVFSKQIDEVLNGTYPKRDMLVVSEQTPQILQEIGLQNLPITMTQKHLYTMSHNDGKYKNANYHDIDIDVIKQLPQALANPLNILKSDTKNDSIVVVTELVDKNDNIIVASIKIDGKGQINDVQFDTNVMTSAYGKSGNYDYFMQDNISKGNLLYDIDEGIIQKIDNTQKKSDVTDRVQFPMRDSSSSTSASDIPKNISPISYNDNSTNLDNSQIMQSSNNINMQNQQNNTQKIPTQEDIRKMELKDTKLPTRKTLNPTEISNLTKEDANTTPILQNANVSTGNGKSKFASNIKNKTNMLNEDSKNAILSNNDVNYYREVTNEESLNQAFERLNTNGKSEVERWFRQDSENANSTDVAEGWILLKQYQDQISKVTDLNAKNELNRSMVQVAKKLRDMGTKAGQTVQAFNILNRLTPEGMVYYAQSELDEAFQHMVKNKSQDWINKYKSDFELTPQETQFILDTMQEVSQMQDGYDKRVKLAEIQKLMTDKLPPQKGAGIKAWMRISMLFNPKTQVRNVVGNALIAPVNSFSDLIGSVVDKRLAKSTNIRTTGTTSLKNYGKGLKKGLFESYNDFKKGINTRNIEGNRFEIGQGRSFNNKTKIGKALNRVDNFLSFLLDAGDRGFYEASFVNSINNQMVLNNTTEVTQDMIDIATSEALQRTWQDNNNYTRFVMNIRKTMNAGKEYGLGDILIPFAKTPANLTKAIVDYSPVGLINSINKGIRFKRSLTNGQFTPQLQHDFVQTLGKATAGSMLYVIGYALAKAGVTSGESDDDKDVSNFLKNTLGINSYSIKIGDKSFAYDWAQPLAAPLAITANIVQKDKENKSLVENIISSLDTAGSILLEQSFMDSLNTVFNNNDGVVTGLQEALLELPSRAVPTVFKQIADMVDGTQRTSFEYNKPLETAVNKVKAKIPFLSQILSPSVDTLGRDIQKYGGNNNIFNVFFNPANVSTENISESASEIYRLYKETGDKIIMPRVAPYYINQDGNKITLSASEKAKYQSISGQIIEDNVNDLLDNDIYNAMNDENKTEIINKIVNFSYNKAREEVLNIPMSDEYNKINMYINDGGTPSDYYINKEEIDYSYENPSKYSTITQITTYAKYQNYNDAIKDIKEQYEDSNQRKYSVINYVNGLNLSVPQKAMLIKLNYSSFKDYDNQIIEYINSQNMTIAEKTTILEQLGFTVRNGRVYS